MARKTSEEEKDVESSEEEEEEEEAMDEEDDDDERPAKRPRVNKFIDDMADVSDDDDEEEEDDAEAAEELQRDFLAKEDDATATEAAAAARPRNEKLVFGDEEPDITEEQLNERYQDYTRAQAQGKTLTDHDLQSQQNVTQQSLLPSVRDPKLWCIPCKVGKERTLCIQLMNKFFKFQGTEKALKIKSVVHNEQNKGYIHVEADREGHVTDAIYGLRDIYFFKLKLVQLNQMTAVLEVKKRRTAVKKGSWVRLRLREYKGDLGQVFEVDDIADEIIVKVVPRLDLSELTHPGQKKKKGQRPPAKFFNPKDITELNGIVEQKRDTLTGNIFFFYKNFRFDADGYMYKISKLRSLTTEGVVPTLDELQRFQNQSTDRGHGSDSDAEQSDNEAFDLSGLTSRKTQFLKGDFVKVIAGELTNLLGIVESVDGDTIEIIPKHKDLPEDPVAFQIDQLSKYFKQGDHVKVIDGKYKGETGTIVKVEDNIAYVFTDLVENTIKVFTHDLQRSSEVSTGLDSIGQYELYDMVEINPHTVGVIIRVERESFRVIDNNGRVQPIALAQIGSKRNTRRATALGAHQTALSKDDKVKVLVGEHRGKTGTIKHLYRSVAFVHSRDHVRDSGVFTVRAGDLQPLGLRNQSGALADLGVGGRSAASPHLGDQPARGPAGRGGGRGRNAVDPLVGRKVTIKSGVMKGYSGRVIDVTGVTARIELASRPQPAVVKKENLTIVDSQRSGGRPGFYVPGTPSHLGGQTPRWDGAQTPSHHAPNTPGRDAPSTPKHASLWNPDRAMPMSPSHSSPWESQSAGGASSIGGGSGWGDSNSYGVAPSMGHSPASSQYSQMSNDPYAPPASGTPGGTRTPGGYNTPYDPTTPYDPSTPNQGFTPGAAMSNSPFSSGGEYSPAMTGGSSPSSQQQAPSVHGSDATGSEISGYSGLTGSSGPQGAPSSWLEKGIVVNIANTKTQARVVERLENGSFTLKPFQADGTVADTTLTMRPDQLGPAKPERNQSVRVIAGNDRGQTGTLIGVDGRDGIVKVGEDIKILEMSSLTRFDDNA